jgi:hypothetical protein
MGNPLPFADLKFFSVSTFSKSIWPANKRFSNACACICLQDRPAAVGSDSFVYRRQLNRRWQPVFEIGRRLKRSSCFRSAEERHIYCRTSRWSACIRQLERRGQIVAVRRVRSQTEDATRENCTAAKLTKFQQSKRADLQSSESTDNDVIESDVEASARPTDGHVADEIVRFHWVTRPTFRRSPLILLVKRRQCIASLNSWLK